MYFDSSDSLNVKPSNSTQQKSSFGRYVVGSLLVHLVMLLYFVSQPISLNKPQEPEAIRSYLVIENPKPVKKAPLKQLQTESNQQTQAQRADSNPHQVPLNQEVAENTPEPKEVTEVNAELPVRQADNQVKANTNRWRSYNNQQYLDEISPDKPQQNWQQYQQQQQGRITSQRKQNVGLGNYNQSLVPEMSQTRELAKNGDGSITVSHHGRCFNIVMEQGESRWTPETCPLSADKNRQLLRDILKKHIPKKR